MAHTNIKLYGTLRCSDCKMTKKFFGEQRVHYEFIDVDTDKEGLAFVEKVNNGKQIIPTLVFEDGSTLVEPSNAELAARLGLQTAARNTFYDLIVIGSGPAGLTAALYAAREGMDTLVIERGGVGGQAGITERLDNFPGFPEGISGSEFADRLRQQAERFGVEILQAQEVTEISLDDQYRCVKTSDGKETVAGPCSSRWGPRTAGWRYRAKTTSSARACTSAPPATDRFTVVKKYWSSAAVTRPARRASS